MPQKLPVGVIGIGAMGMGVAKSLLRAGFEVHVRDVRPEAEAEAKAAGAVLCASPAAIAAAAHVIVTLVVDAPQTAEVLFGTDGVAHASDTRHVILMCSTIAPEDAQRFADRLGERGSALLDAPVSGGPARAHAGSLFMMASGPARAFDRAQAVLAAMASRIFRLGKRAGDGSRMKIVNNMMAGANLAAACEAMTFALKLGLEPRTVFQVVNASSGASWIFSDRMARALADDYAPRAALRILTKDVGLFVAAANASGYEAPVAKATLDAFRAAVERGFGDEDDAALIKSYAIAAKVDLRAG